MNVLMKRNALTRRNRAFTLIEMLVVVLILAILADWAFTTANCALPSSVQCAPPSVDFRMPQP